MYNLATQVPFPRFPRQRWRLPVCPVLPASAESLWSIASPVAMWSIALAVQHNDLDILDWFKRFKKSIFKSIPIEVQPAEQFITSPMFIPPRSTTLGCGPPCIDWLGEFRFRGFESGAAWDLSGAHGKAVGHIAAVCGPGKPEFCQRQLQSGTEMAKIEKWWMNKLWSSERPRKMQRSYEFRKVDLPRASKRTLFQWVVRANSTLSRSKGWSFLKVLYPNINENWQSWIKREDAEARRQQCHNFITLIQADLMSLG